MTTATRFETIDEVKAANERDGRHFFEPATLPFFRSRIGQNLYGGRYFTTSEQFNSRSPRLYTIREVMDSGAILTVGGLQQYQSARQAVAAIKELLS